MNNKIKEIASILENNIGGNNTNVNETHYIQGLNSEQTELINNFVKELGKSGFFPFPLKAR